MISINKQEKDHSTFQLLNILKTKTICIVHFKLRLANSSVFVTKPLKMYIVFS